MYVNLLSNFAGAARRERYNGRDYLVAPLTMIVPGVLAGSNGALLYTLEEISKTVALWEGVPITRDHPYLNGRPTSARTAGVLDRQGIGLVRNPSIFNGRLVAEGWFDVEDCRRLAPRVLKALERGDPLELSTGLFTETIPATGVHRGRTYSGVVLRPQPDHLAVFDGDQVGACSLRDGCGVHVNSLSTFGEPTMSFVPRFMLDDDDLTLNQDERREDVLEIPTVNYDHSNNQHSRPACNCGGATHNQAGARTGSGIMTFYDPELLIPPEIVW